MSTSNKGRFIVFEGIDGSGTSTQSKMLIDYLNKKDTSKNNAVPTCEPSDGPIGNMIRQAFKGRVSFTSDHIEFDKQMAYLFAADRHDHLHNDIDGVFALNKRGLDVISTRYFFSSLVYHVNSEKEYNFINKLNEEFPLPDICIYIDNPVEVSMKRMENRAFKDTYETEEKLTLVKSNYEKVWKDYPEVFRVDGTLGVNDIHKLIVAKIESLEEYDIMGVK